MASKYDDVLGHNPASYQPLTPMTCLARTALIYPDKIAVVDGTRRDSYCEFYARRRRLASALAARGVETVQDLLFLAPLRYRQPAVPGTVATALPGQRLSVVGQADLEIVAAAAAATISRSAWPTRTPTAAASGSTTRPGCSTAWRPGPVSSCRGRRRAPAAATTSRTTAGTCRPAPPPRRPADRRHPGTTRRCG